MTQVTRVNAFVRGLGTPPGSVQVAQCAILSGVGPSAGAKTGAWEHTGAVGVGVALYKGNSGTRLDCFRVLLSHYSVLRCRLIPPH